MIISKRNFRYRQKDGEMGDAFRGKEITKAPDGFLDWAIKVGWAEESKSEKKPKTEKAPKVKTR